MRNNGAMEFHSMNSSPVRRDLVFSRDMPPAQQRIYQDAFPVQLSRTCAGIFANLRVCNTTIIDLEAGMDKMVFDSLDDLKLHATVPLFRIGEVDHPRTGHHGAHGRARPGWFAPDGLPAMDAEKFALEMSVRIPHSCSRELRSRT